ncbi:glycosyltransferase family 2 protein [Sulfitobacter sp. F26204]|uniref:glycosyltransferase family 2 protein n=1 Tax=Sulfitobacter sp. F26204 TaxID=2996014 RepID=UPI00225E007D|nr:glycosyltransferase family 2 protein [Sulfitobacter sp. F26204]MCX7559445.1 glycosyltransferase family 2 protein [Sulfitobacter sp. F26204]
MSDSWGISATILAPVATILDFAAYHLEAGAHRLYLYLDDDNQAAFDILKAHPKIKPTLCNDAWWRGKRPKKHQVRQTQNATHAYHRRTEVDWLIHMDVDEFLVAQQPVGEILAALPKADKIARIRPMEQLAGDGSRFKAFVPNGPDRARIVAELYPTYGPHIKGGFLSHLAGKCFVRSGLQGMRIQIHNAFQHDQMLQGPETTAGIDLAHCHATSWEEWYAAFRYRFDKGSYRAELAPNRPREKGGLSMHELFATIEAENGETGLRAFFDEVCADTPALRRRLASQGLLREVKFDLNTTTAKHFPHHSS